MININITGIDEVKRALANAPKLAERAAEMALDFTARHIKSDIQREMLIVFDAPTQWTLNSLQVTPTKGHNMMASVWFKEPGRMGQHYLVPLVEGGSRKLKGFERALGLGEMVPGSGVKLDQYGNIPGSQIVQIMSVLGGFNRYAGDNTNITSRSRKSNTKERDYVVITKRRGKLYPGVYQRVQTGAGFGAKTKRTFSDRSKAYQKGRTRGRFSSVIRARGLKPIMITGRTGHSVKPLLDFYGVAERAFNAIFERRFWANLERLSAEW